jgi:hypothetical protein
VAILKSDANCVWYWQTFKAMEWPSRLVDLSVVLGPLCGTLMFWGDWDLGLGWRVASIAGPGILWLVIAEYVSRYVRGCPLDPA